MEKQLNVWIDGTLKDAIGERAQQEKMSLKELTEAILSQEMARYRGELMEQQAVPVFREMLQRELSRSLAQLHLELREEITTEIVATLKTWIQKNDDRLASLLVRTLRDEGINRRLVFALLAKSFGPEFAHEAYENAMQKAGQELAARVRKSADARVEGQVNGRV